MYHVVDPKQTRLFDPFGSVLTERTRKSAAADSMAGRACFVPATADFQHIILELMPVETVSEHFDPTMGRPSKELYSMAGWLLLMEFMDWTKQEALDAYSFRMDPPKADRRPVQIHYG